MLWLRLAAPCRAVYVVNEPSCRGFAYERRPGKPERGEEAFIVSMAKDGTVTFEVAAFSRPAAWLSAARRRAPDYVPLPECWQSRNAVTARQTGRGNPISKVWTPAQPGGSRRQHAYRQWTRN